VILQALKEYYDRKSAGAESDIAPEGFEKKEIPFLIVINNEGQFVNLEDTREKVGSRMIGKSYLVPRSESRAGSNSFKTTFLLWDHFGYLLGHPESDEKSPKQFKTWLDTLNVLPENLKMDEGVAAILKFYKLNGVESVKASSNWQDCAKNNNHNITFRLEGDFDPVPCRSAIKNYIQQRVLAEKDTEKREDEQDSNLFGHCLITGEFGEIVRTHHKTPINKDSNSLVGFQRNSGYDSYGKEQAYNAPVSKSSEFAYTTALNILLKSVTSRMQVGDASTIFWSEKDTNLEHQFTAFFDEPPKDDPDKNVRAVESLFNSVETGAFSIQGSKNRFYVLGLAPNKARISVRFWIVDTVASMAGKIAQHFEDLKISHGPKEREFFSLFRLLISIATQEESKNIPPNLAGDIMCSILSGLPYPKTLLQAAIRRIRAEQSKKDKKSGRSLPNITHERAALIKACINRQTRHNTPERKEELKMSLDKTNLNIGYRLGRLFATLEKIQEESHPGINATIRDRFYGAASGTPATVFGNLMRLKNHHLAKLENKGRRVYFERLLAEIIDGIEAKSAMPAHLNIDDQGRFAIGYYHQVQDFYTKKSV